MATALFQMAVSVLGKRTRSTAFTDESLIPANSRKRVHVLEDAVESLQVLPDTLVEGDNICNFPTSNSSSKHLEQGNCTDILPLTTILSDASENTPTFLPQTPRHRDALSKKAPITPRHRLLVGARPLTPSTPRVLSTPTGIRKTIYGDARKLFTRGSNPGALVGREKERAELNNFISTRVAAGTGGCLYVSGPPGTGKSALVTEICQSVQHEHVKYIYLNCMSVKNTGDVCPLVAAELGPTIGSARNEEAGLKALFLDKRSKTSYVVVLDEIDSLLNLDPSTLYSLFEWGFVPNSRLILIGIANALDLTDRFLPRLKAANLKPALLPFLPYTAPEIASVVTSRCRSLLPAKSTTAGDFVPVLHPSAIQLISKKVASQTGDLRKSFDIAQRVIDLIESETREKLASEALQHSPSKSPLAENPNISSPKNPFPSPSKHAKPSALGIQTYDAVSAPRATLAHVVRITSAFFNNSTVSRLASLNLQQKAVLFSLVGLEKRNKQLGTPPATPSKNGKRGPVALTGSQAPTIRMLGEAYNSVCKRDNVLHALSGTEFRDVVGGLESCSLIVMVDGRKGGLASGPGGKRAKTGFGATNGGDERKIASCVSIEDCEGATDGVGRDILRGILFGDGF